MEKKTTIQQHSDLHAGNYHLIGADLRQLKELEQKLEQCQIDATIPTIFIAECVLVYMSADASANLLEFFAQKFSAATEFLNYEQFRAADAFTKVMEQNLEQRGIHLHGLQMCESEEKQVERFKNAGFKNVQVYDMNRVFKELLDQKEAARIQKIDFLDEMELLYQLLAHYCIVHAEK
ncbi:unnamed protein product [Caenorhabditis angaria]|uniref:[phosphatase 2A protein]-leucine-carboxy methyltransferase n=1 Tax=Caenorhabditis angaria TaxID=860376 RepID=A0A9P1N167_9PELO|nr:unnamed protein product [Caenorhabditis angaria]